VLRVRRTFGAEKVGELVRRLTPPLKSRGKRRKCGIVFVLGQANCRTKRGVPSIKRKKEDQDKHTIHGTKPEKKGLKAGGKKEGESRGLAVKIWRHRKYLSSKKEKNIRET